jgi:aminopeptidase YwaD
MSLRTHRRIALALIAAFAVLLAACGGSSKASVPLAATTIATAAPAAQPTPTASPDTLGAPSPDGQRAYDVVRKLAVEIGPRPAGTPAEIAARDEIKALLAGYGYDVTVQDFAFDASAFLPARVDVGTDALQAIALAGSPSGSAAGRIIGAGLGRPSDYPPGGVAGGIALVQRGEIEFAEKAQNALAAGAAGVIIYNNVAGRVLGDLRGPSTIPVVSISQADGEALAARAAASPVDAKITVSPPKGTAYNVVAKPKGVTTCTTITGGHYDSVAVTGGADDNAAGSASVIETARVAAALRLPGANCFVLFSAEEFGLFGSKAFVQAMAPADVTALRVMINLDVVGVAQPLELIGSPDMVDTARVVAQKLGVTATVAELPKGAGSDHLSFQDAGVPVVMLYRNDPLIHTPADAIDRIDAASLRETVAVAIGTLQALDAGG